MLGVLTSSPLRRDTSAPFRATNYAHAMHEDRNRLGLPAATAKKKMPATSKRPGNLAEPMGIGHE